jgi:Tol biopolymer transport system component
MADGLSTLGERGRRYEHEGISGDQGGSAVTEHHRSGNRVQKAWVAATIVTCTGTVTFGPDTAQAAFCGVNGLITYTSAGGIANDDIYVTDETASTHVRLTTDPARDIQSAVSPNGKEIVFASQRNTLRFPNPERDLELYVMDAVDDEGIDGPDGEGDGLRRLTDNGAPDFGPAWSPDGAKVAFVSGRDGNSEIYVMDADGTEPVRLTDHPLADQVPRFSPDGSRIVFQRSVAGNQEIFVMDAAGATPTNLSNNAALDSLPDFSPDGTKITFGSTRDGGDVDVWVMTANGTDPQNLTPSRSTTNDRWSRWSPDGTRIVFWSGTGDGLGDGEILTLNAGDGSGLTNITNSPQEGEAFPDWGPARPHPPEDPTVSCPT